MKVCKATKKDQFFLVDIQKSFAGPVHFSRAAAVGRQEKQVVDRGVGMTKVRKNKVSCSWLPFETML